MDNSIFIGDLRQELGKLCETRSPILKFEEYTTVKSGEIEYIVGKSLIGDENNLKVRRDKPQEYEDDIGNNIYADFEILFSLFKLINLEKYSPRCLEKPESNTVILTEEIIDWCYRYGYPFNPIARELYKPEGGFDYRFDVRDFHMQVGLLYTHFLLWKAILDSNETDVDKYIFLTGLKASQFKNSKDKISAVKRYLPNLLGSSRLHLKYDSKKDVFCFGVFARDLFDVAYFQLATLMTKPNKDIKDNFKICPLEDGGCGSMFWGHGNMKYCNNCDRRTIWSRKHKK